MVASGVESRDSPPQVRPSTETPAATGADKEPELRMEAEGRERVYRRTETPPRPGPRPHRDRTETRTETPTPTDMNTAIGEDELVCMRLKSAETCMKFGGESFHVAALLHCFLLADLIQSAPTISPANWPADSSAALRAAAERVKTLVEKILRDVPAAHAATVTIEGLTLDSAHTTNLQMMVTSLGIPAAPVLKPPSERFTLDVCMSRMSAGSRLYQRLLGDLSDRLSGLSDLQADLRDLQTHIRKMEEAAHLDVADQNQSLDLASRLHSNYELQVAAHLTLTQLRSFSHDLIRSLRAVATYRPQPAGAR
ncbi:uncharacterized protein LOC117735481 isoform X1 [Cyclopterus lumpus]|uniref:uncharacterized protein LOC117735481 isoform X1 n=1 Tax=Cyclopterus lumpus TaxID=8103 RepID=UPI0014867289|nr:uncharacterized protein LOC117735481 isoform X1 [Cyclopterus lumpus]XP_034396016.1 uncharacterized protein LOC117735481 isoform X1 [Cyclopterus lumpus]